MKPIAGQLTIAQGEKVLITSTNTAFRQEIIRYVKDMWLNNRRGNPKIQLWPWKSHKGYNDANSNIRHVNIGPNTSAIAFTSPNTDMSTKDYRKYKMSGSASYTQTDQCKAFGAVIATDPYYDCNSYGGQPAVMSIAEIPKVYTQIGNVFPHPIYTAINYTISTLGQNYITPTSYQDFYWRPGMFDFFRIDSGPDKGVYQINHNDRYNNRVYLRHLDGSLFSAQGTGTFTALGAFGPRYRYFNETNIIANSAGSVELSGRFDPGIARSHYILKVVYEKSGSPNAADPAQNGSYYFTLTNYTHGDYNGSTPDYWYNSLVGYQTGIWNGTKQFVGGVTGYGLDEPNQRLWFGTSDGTNSGLFYWYYKSVETIHEVLNSSNNPSSPEITLPYPTLTGTLITSLKMGSDNTVYVAFYNSTMAANACLVAIKPDLTAVQYRTTENLPSANIHTLAVDSSATRSGTAFRTDGGSICHEMNAAMKATDVGRVIKIKSGTNAGVYKIASVIDASNFTVSNVDGSAVTLVNTGATNYDWEIGDRIYLFFADTTTNDGHLHYMESLAQGVFHQTPTFTQTNGKKIRLYPRWGDGTHAMADSNGCVYWLSEDVQQQVNKYDPATNTFSYRTFANLQTPPNSNPATPTAITSFNALVVNPTFDELWIGTDVGHVRIPLSDFTTTTKFTRYYGTDYNNSYAQPTGYWKVSGSAANNTNNHNVRSYALAPDNKVYSVLMNGGSSEMVAYGREADNWFTMTDGSIGGSASYPARAFIDPYGMVTYICPNGSDWYSTGLEIQYQWDPTLQKWYPREISKGPLPNRTPTDTISPGCIAKPLHTDAQDLVMGVKIKFKPSANSLAAPNNEFLGRCGLILPASRTDGIMPAGTTATLDFLGSGFTSNDVGRYLRIENGTTAVKGVYYITDVKRNASNNVIGVVIKRVTGATFNVATQETGLTFSVWDFGSLGTNSGPETATAMWADGYGKDNTQDISNITYEFFGMKTIASEFDEPVKFCVDPVGPPGSIGITPYYEVFGRTSAQYLPSLGAHRALPSTPQARGLDLYDNILDKVPCGNSSNTNAVKADSWSNLGSSDYNWSGINANSGLYGYHASVDLGADVEVGSILFRFWGNQSPGYPCTCLHTNGYNGQIANLYNAPWASIPAADSSTVRITGSSHLNVAVTATAVTLSAGYTADFFGTAVLSRSDGAIALDQNILYSAPGAFIAPTSTSPGHLGMILSVAGAGADTGAYRIIGVSADGSTVAVRNLDMTPKTWLGSAANLVFFVYDGVQEEDKIVCGAAQMVVERVLSSTSLQVRIPVHAALTNQSWTCVKPVWRHIKRLSNIINATPPDVSNNGTWISTHGREQFDERDFKFFFDLSDQPTWKRTGRFWRLSMHPRWQASQGQGNHHLVTIEFYDPSGAPINFCSYNRVDTVTDPNFLACSGTRLDFIQSSNSAVGNVSYNGLANLGGSDGSTVTLANGAKFLGFQVRPQAANGSTNAGTALFNGSGFTSSDVGRFLYCVDIGTIYRIATVNSATQVSLVTPAGNAVTLTGNSGINYTIHEGISVSATAPDYINFGTAKSGLEFPISAISDDLTTITLATPTYMSLTNQAWEIRRRAFEAGGTTPAPNASATARIIYIGGLTGSYPQQPGDVAWDSRGYLRFYGNDIGSGNQRTDGATGTVSGQPDHFDGSGFCPDDVGRIVVLATASANRGTYRIGTYVSPTRVRLVNLYTGSAASFSPEPSIVYRVYGERRFRAARYVTVMRA